jgi:hypothetical protein
MEAICSSETSVDFQPNDITLQINTLIYAGDWLDLQFTRKLSVLCTHKLDESLVITFVDETALKLP